MPVNGPDFISIQVSDLDASAAFYEQHLGLTRQPGPPHAVVFATKPIAFAVRDAAPGFDPSAGEPSGGVALWFHAPDAQGIHDALVAAGVTIAGAPIDGPFGRTFTFLDPDGYRVTLHDRG
jgi:predicted enzyme related to lactoylglutathione lyase